MPGFRALAWECRAWRTGAAAVQPVKSFAERNRVSGKDWRMRSVHKVDDLSFEPSLREMLADPVMRALMARDGVSEDELVQLSLAARTRLLRTRDSVVMPFPGPRQPPAAASADTERRFFSLRRADGSGDGR